MTATALAREERVGLALAVAAHIALVAFLVWRPLGRPMLPTPERMTVTISDEVGMTSTSPEPAAQPAPDVAPDLGEPAPPEPEALPPVSQPPKPQPSKPQPPKPEPIVKPPPLRPAPRPVPRAQPAPARPAPPRPAPPRPTPPRPVPPRPAPPRPAPARAQRARPAQSQPATRPPSNAGASRIGDDFLKGTPAAQNTGASRNPPAQAIGPAVRSSLAGAISRKLKPKWAAPQGVDADKLVTILSWSLNRDGTLAGRPTVVRQEGITDSNRPQAARHAEQAIRAVQLAAPFDLPEEYYDAWKRVASFRFDRKLSQ